MRAPIMAVGIAGAYTAWSRHRHLPRFSPLFLPQSGHSIEVVYGPPRDPKTLDGLSREQILEVLHDDIAAAVAAAESRLRL
jgi:hypothetical protein